MDWYVYEGYEGGTFLCAAGIFGSAKPSAREQTPLQLSSLQWKLINQSLDSEMTKNMSENWREDPLAMDTSLHSSLEDLWSNNTE